MLEAVSRYNVCLVDDLVYVVKSEGVYKNSCNAVHRFNPVANVWSTVAPMSIARNMHGASNIGRVRLRSGWPMREQKGVPNGALLGGLGQVVGCSRRIARYGK
jgi:hypothetical protein